MKKKIKDILKSINNSNTKINNVLELTSTKYTNHEQLIEYIKNTKDYFLIISILTPQSKSSLHQKLVEKKFNLTSINSKNDKGDSIDKNGKHYEIKCSTPSASGNKLNIVQIRPHQDIDFYLCVFIDDIKYVNNFLFILSGEDMKEEIYLMGSGAHGVNDTKFHPKKEFRITLDLDNMNSEHLKRWLLKYRKQDEEKKLFN